MKRFGSTFLLFTIVFSLLVSACGATRSNQVSDEQNSVSNNSGSDSFSNASLEPESSSQKQSFTIIWKNYDGSVLEIDENIEEGTIPTYDGSVPTRPEDGVYSYSWSGWTPEVVPATANQTYTAAYLYEKIKVEYVIDFDLNGGISSSYSGPKTVGAFTKDIFFFDCLKEGWNFRGWSYEGTKVFDEKGNQLSNPTMAKEMTFVATYSQTTKMTIITNLEGAGTISGEGEYPYNTYVDVSAHPLQGYVFIGWYYNNTLLSNTPDYKYMMWNEDVVLEARFKLDSFLMKVWSNNEDCGLVLLKSVLNNDYLPSYEEYREYTASITIAAYSKTDVRFLGWYDANNKLVETNAVYSFVMPNYDYVLEAKWNFFTITYNLNNGTNDSSNPTNYSIDESSIVLKNPTKKGYDFLGWKYGNEYITEINSQWAKNITLNAIWKAHDYSITYVLNGGINNSLNPKQYTIESDTISLNGASREGYTFEGWYRDQSLSIPISEIENGSYGDITLYAKWAPISYSITYILDGGTNSENNPITYTIESSFSFFVPTKTGYTFLGWFDEGDTQVVSIAPGRIGSLTLTAHWTANLNNLSVTSEDASKGTVAITSGSGYSDELITVVASPIGDCVFKGWYHESEKINDNSTYTFVMPKSDYSLVAHFFTKAEEEQEERRKIALGITPIVDVENLTLTYGLYPQKHINDSSLIDSLDALTSPESNDWYLYDDEYYAKLSATPYESNYKFDDGTQIVNGEVYWFKCEPITWNILFSNGGQHFLLSSVLLDAHCYWDSQGIRYIDGKAIYANNYKYSDVRTWLNDVFYNSAFALGKDYIQTTIVDNSASTTNNSSNSYACANTEDNVFLLSYQDYCNSDYGFSKTYTRCCKTTDWARARGAYAHNFNGEYQYNGLYLTRSPNSTGSGYIWIVNNAGELGSSSGIGRNDYSVRPCIFLKIS